MNLRLAAAVSMTLVFACAAAAHAEDRDQVLEALGKCAAITDSTQRLACYDALAPRVKDALGHPPQVASHPPTKEEQQSWFGFDLSGLFGSAPEQQTTPEKFGSEQIPQTRKKVEAAKEEIDHITVPVTEVTYNPFGKFVVFLKNGQIWKQIPGDADHARFPHNLDGVTVTIDRGLLGSYNLRIGDSNQIFKVTRVK